MERPLMLPGSGRAEALAFHREALVFAVLALASLGLVVGYSLAGTDLRLGLPQALAGKAVRLLAGLTAYFVCRALPLARLRRALPWLFAAAVVLCCLPRVFGFWVKGTYRWIHVAGFSFQPVELLKPVFVLALASWVAGPRFRSGSFRSGTLPALGILAAAFLAVLVQPDVGHAFFLVSLGLVLLFVGGLALRLAVALAAGGGLALVLVLTSTFRHAQLRLRGFFDAAPGYQLERGLGALQAGGLLGRGLGAGPERMFVPEARNDFVLAALGNELGLFGSLLVVALFALFFYAAHRISRLCRDPWHRLTALGLGASIAFQALFNMLGVTHTIPEKGIDLPFLSAGGTNLVFALASVGLLANIAEKEGAGKGSGPPS